MKEERKKRILKLGLWTLAWVSSLALATFGHMFIWESKFLTVAAITINLIIGIGMIIANKNLYEFYDELEKKIQLESLAISLGLTVIVGLSYSLLDQTDLIQNDAEIGFLVGFIGISYLVSVLINRKRYL